MALLAKRFCVTPRLCSDGEFSLCAEMKPEGINLTIFVPMRSKVEQQQS